MKIEDFSINKLPEKQLLKFWLEILETPLNKPLSLPILAIKSKNKPKICILANIHGYELNGIKVIQELMNNLDTKKINGTIIGIPIVNIPGLLNHQRNFDTEIDLNRFMPGKNTETPLIFNQKLFNLISKFDYVIDLHSARDTNSNSYYAKVELKNKKATKLAKQLAPDIIVNTKASPTTLRGALAKKNTPCITIELGDSKKYDNQIINKTILGIRNILHELKITKQKPKLKNKTTTCKSSEWIYTDRGGLLEVLPEVNTKIKTGQKIAILKDPFGQTLKEYFAPYNAIIIGKRINPIAYQGTGIVHIGKY